MRAFAPLTGGDKQAAITRIQSYVLARVGHRNTGQIGRSTIDGLRVEFTISVRRAHQCFPVERISAHHHQVQQR